MSNVCQLLHNFVLAGVPTYLSQLPRGLHASSLSYLEPLVVPCMVHMPEPP